MARHIAGTDGQAWYTKFHDRNEVIRRVVPRRQVPFAIAVYDVLVALSNRHGDSRFFERIDTVCFHTAMSFNGVRRALEALNGSVISFARPTRDGDGRYALCEFRILKNTKSVHSASASGSQDPLSTSRSTSHSSSDLKMKFYRKNKKKEERTTTTSRARAEDVFVEEVRAEFERCGFVFWNPHSDAALREFAKDLDATRRALKKAGETNVPTNRLIPWVRSFLEREKNPAPRTIPVVDAHRPNRYAPPALRHLQAPEDVFD